MTIIGDFVNGPSFNDIQPTQRRVWMVVVDKTSRKFVVEVPTAAITNGALTNLGDAITDSLLGNMYLYLGGIRPSVVVQKPADPPTDANALLEYAWNVVYRDPVSNNTFSLLLPAADGNLVAPGTQQMDSGWSGYTDFVNEIENSARVPNFQQNGSVVVTSITLAGLDR